MMINPQQPLPKEEYQFQLAMVRREIRRLEDTYGRRSRAWQILEGHLVAQEEELELVLRRF